LELVFELVQEREPKRHGHSEAISLRNRLEAGKDKYPLDHVAAVIEMEGACEGVIQDLVRGILNVSEPGDRFSPLEGFWLAKRYVSRQRF
jgi:hypothetical protein